MLAGVLGVMRLFLENIECLYLWGVDGIRVEPASSVFAGVRVPWVLAVVFVAAALNNHDPIQFEGDWSHL